MPDAGVPLVLYFGSRAGSYTALALFGPLFSALAFIVWREMRKRVPRRRRAASVVAALLFFGPLMLLYGTSLDGFYEAEVGAGRVVLHYLYPATITIPLRDVASVRAAPAFKGRWRLHLVDADGREYRSATSNRDAVDAAAVRLRRAGIR